MELSARQRLAAHDVNGAIEIYEKLAQTTPQSADYQDTIGFLLAATNRSAESIPHFERATQLSPAMAAAWYHLGVARMLQQQTSGVADLQKAVSLAPANAEYRFRLGSAFNEVQRYSDASTELRLATKQLLKNPAVWAALGLALQKQKRFKGSSCRLPAKSASRPR